MSNSNLLLKATKLKKWFSVRTSFFASLFFEEKKFVRAVDTIDLDLKKGKFLCLTGESGCGKTTTGKLIMGLIKPTAGKIYFKGVDIFSNLPKFRTKIQMIYQDPYASTNPRMKIADIVAEPLDVNRLAKDRTDRTKKVADALEEVGLKPAENFIGSFPHELSGGQRQRVAIARALILAPELIIADEPTSMLDASVRIDILNLLLHLKNDLGLTILFITHDLAQARYVGDSIAVMYLGKIVESVSIDDVFEKPAHPYTEILLSSAPSLGPNDKRQRIIIKGETPNPINVPPGCRFHPRCPLAMPICKKKEPNLVKMPDGRMVACHRHTI